MSKEPQEQVIELISTLNESFGHGEPSAAQQALLETVNQHIHSAEQEAFHPSLVETLELLAEDVKDEHPQVATVLQEALRLLGNMGI